MVVFITLKNKKEGSEYSEWMDASQVPEKKLLEMDNGNGEPSGKPAIRIGSLFFYFGQTHGEEKKFRVLPIGGTVVCIQE